MEDAKFATKVLPLRRSPSPCVRAAGGGGRFDRFWLTQADKAGNQFGAGGRGRGGRGRARGGTGVVQARRVTCCPTKVTEINRICPFFFFFCLLSTFVTEKGEKSSPDPFHSQRQTGEFLCVFPSFLFVYLFVYQRIYALYVLVDPYLQQADNGL